MIEVCAFSLESCLVAQQAKANRIELCGGMFEGGTTPSIGLAMAASKKIAIPIRVMLRPRGGDFCYSEQELEVIVADLAVLNQANFEGYVIGILQPNGKVNKEQLKGFLALARKFNKNAKFTFHRAFDVSENPFEALEDIIELGFDTILTSGQKNTALEGIDLLADLVKAANRRINIMAGSGVNAENAEKFLKIGINALHLTGKSTIESTMIYRKSDVSMANGLQLNEFEKYQADLVKCSEVVAIYESFGG